MPQIDIEPFYFASVNGRSLFGCYHKPIVEGDPVSGVVLCYPHGHEYTAAHRAFRQLATRLARSGLPVLRFDYSGCGDSAGDREEGSVSEWLDDIRSAILELKRRSLCSRIQLVGLRLGATLSILSGSELGGVEAMVIWDPVVSGAQYLAELNRLHEEHSEYPSGPDDEPQILGYPFTAAMRSELEGLDLLAIESKPADEVLVVETGEQEGDGARLVRHLRTLGARAEIERVPAAVMLLERVDKVTVPGKLIQKVVAWLSVVR